MATLDLLRRVAQLTSEEFRQPQISQLLFDEKFYPEKPDEKVVSRLQKEAIAWLLRAEAEASAADDKSLLKELGVALTTKYRHLQDALVIRAHPVKNERQYSAHIARLGKVAADYFDVVLSDAEQAENDMLVSISGGETNLEMVTNLPRHPRNRVYFCTTAIVGRGRYQQSSHVGPEANATIAWSRSGRFPGHLLYATGPSPEGCYNLRLDAAERHKAACEAIVEGTKRFAELPQTKPILTDMGMVNMAVVGLSIVDPKAATLTHSARLSMTGLLRPHGVSPELLVKDGAAGGLAYSLFDSKGNGREEWQFYVTAGYPDPISFYRNLVHSRRKVMAIAGMFKEEAVRVAVEHELISVLVTDEPTANHLLGDANWSGTWRL